MKSMGFLILAVSLFSGAAAAQGKSNLAVLSQEEADLLEFLDSLSKSVEASRAQERRLTLRVSKLQQWQAGLLRLSEVSRTRQVAQEKAMGPGLVAFDRLTRKPNWVLAVTAESFSEFWNATWASRRFLSAQVAAVERWAQATALAQQCADELNWLQSRLSLEQQALVAARRKALLRHLEFEEGLVWVLSEKSRAQKLLKQWEEARSQVSRLTPFDKSMSASLFFSRKGHLTLPSKGTVEVGFGKVINPRFNTMVWQRGLDFRASEGTPVQSVAPGKVVYADWLKGYGYLVIVDHGEGFHSLYAHLQNMSAKVGGAIGEGETLGQVGDSGSLKGPYLYFELRYRGTPVDPALWLGPSSKQ